MTSSNDGSVTLMPEGGGGEYPWPLGCDQAIAFMRMGETEWESESEGPMWRRVAVAGRYLENADARSG